MKGEHQSRTDRILSEYGEQDLSPELDTMV